MRLASPAAAVAIVAIVTLLATPLHGQQTADTTVVVVRGPTVVACWTPQDQANPVQLAESADASGDFARYWSQSSVSFPRAGVAAELREAKVVWLEDENRLRSVPCPGVGYVFAAPGRQPRVIKGARTDEDVHEAAAAYFGRRGLVLPRSGNARQR